MKATVDANQAVARVAYACSDLAVIYPITPSSPMGERADELSAGREKNIWGTVPEVVEMQSEGGVAGAFHGALGTGALATTFTSSQGLLLMIPNLYRIAGELLPGVLHVAARALAVNGTCIFGDHSDVMACRQTGFAMLASASVQEAQDLALVAHAATLETRVPFLHFFDGFRTSHEVQKIDELPVETIRALIDDDAVAAQRARGLSPEHPVFRGTVQNSDVYFQGREAQNPYYDKVPGVVQRKMDELAARTGRAYRIFDYYGAPDATRVVVAMASGVETVRETVEEMNRRGDRVGVVAVRLYRPFARDAFLSVLPATVTSVTVLDRTKECGSAGEPLYLDVATTIDRAFRDGTRTGARPAVYAARYALGGKEFTPQHVKAVFDNMSAAQPKDGYAIGVEDDLTGRSIPPAADFAIDHVGRHEGVFWGLGSDGTVGANKNSIKIIGSHTDFYAQGYFVYDSKKAGGITVSHLRFGPEPIRSPYLCTRPNFVACHHFAFLSKYDVLGGIAEKGTFLLASPYGPADVGAHLPDPVRRTIREKSLNFYVIDAEAIARQAGMGSRINTVMQAAFFRISGILPPDEAIACLKEAAERTYARKGADVVAKNVACIDAAAGGIRKVDLDLVPAPTGANPMKPIVPAEAPAFVREVTAKMLGLVGDELPVSKVPDDGTWPLATTQWEKRGIASEVPVWNPAVCVQCGRCVGSCPHAALRMKALSPRDLDAAPAAFKHAPAKTPKLKTLGGEVSITCSTADCTGCGLCVSSCPAAKKGALAMVRQDPMAAADAANWKFFLSLPDADPAKLDVSNYADVQFKRPLFEFSGACAGCGEAPYLRLLTQLCGERLQIANATGCSSVYAGNLPTAPYCARTDGKGVAWGNSLFEDNAEYGLGMRVTCDRLAAHAREIVRHIATSDHAPDALKALCARIETIDQATPAGVEEMRTAVAELKARLAGRPCVNCRALRAEADYLVRKSIWLVGGDGWAYDIGYGGLDHVIASGRNVKILVLDSEVYSNTGGQASKATPKGAVAKFAVAGKPAMKKNLGEIALTYGNVYVAQISLGANPQAALKALAEADAYDGPALVIAYAHCVAHGIDMAAGFERQKVAVETGHFPLFRYNPARVGTDKPPLQLDSHAPSKSFAETALGENRFKSLFKTNPDGAKELLASAEEGYRRNWSVLERLAGLL